MTEEESSGNPPEEQDEDTTRSPSDVANTANTSSLFSTFPIGDGVASELMRVYESMTGGAIQQNHQPIIPAPIKSASSIPIPPAWPVQEGGDTSKRALRKRKASSSMVVDEDYVDEEEADADETKMSRRSKNKKDLNGRWSKRFTWPDELHRDFVAAIFDVGLKHSSPSSLFEAMPSHPDLSTERIKSHLQKYRLHRAKSKRDFMTAYGETMEKMGKEGTEGFKMLSDGQVAAHLAYSTIHDKPTDPPETTDSGDTTVVARTASKNTPTHSQQEPHTLILPQLTEEEKNSPIGASLGYVTGLFFSLQNLLMTQRNGKQIPPVTDVVTPWPGAVTVSTSHSTVATTAAPAPTAPSTRSNLEQNSMMKREMESQMAVQNKMRALKQQELDKYRQGPEVEINEAAGQPDDQRARSLSMGEDFLALDEEDEKNLFEFLMGDPA